MKTGKFHVPFRIVWENFHPSLAATSRNLYQSQVLVRCLKHLLTEECPTESSAAAALLFLLPLLQPWTPTSADCFVLNHLILVRTENTVFYSACRFLTSSEECQLKTQTQEYTMFWLRSGNSFQVESSSDAFHSNPRLNTRYWDTRSAS